jgi:hypothetical protein
MRFRRFEALKSGGEQLRSDQRSRCVEVVVVVEGELKLENSPLEVSHVDLIEWTHVGSESQSE